MKNILISLSLFMAIMSCSKIEEKVTQTVTQTTNRVTQKAQENVREMVSESLHSMTNAQNSTLSELFPNTSWPEMTNLKGKQVVLPTGSTVYVFKYNADFPEILSTLELQTTSNEKKSDKKAIKIDGQSMIDKVLVLQKFIPENTVDLSFLQDLKNDSGVEYYQIKRFPNKSTLIYQPKNQQIFHFIEIMK